MQEKTSQEPLKKTFSFQLYEKNTRVKMVFVRFQRFSICLLLSLTRSFFNNMDLVDGGTLAGLKNAIFTETEQIKKIKKEEL